MDSNPQFSQKNEMWLEIAQELVFKAGDYMSVNKKNQND